MAKGFAGGVWLNLDEKIDANLSVRSMPSPARLSYPLPRKGGKTASPLVKEGDRVLLGQPLCADGGAAFCPVHASVSGSVARIAERDIPYIGARTVVEVENDHRSAPFVQKPRARDYYAIPGRELLETVKNAGIESEGNRPLPLWLKLEEFACEKIKLLLIDAVEDEPYISRSSAVSARYPHDVAFGLYCLLKICGAAEAVLAAAKGSGAGPEKVTAAAGRIGYPLRICRARAKYPASDESLLPRELGLNGAGVLYPGDCYNVCRAVKETCPQISKIITVAGECVEKPQNVEVKLGTPVKDILDFCGLSQKPARVVLGGLMRGESVADLSVPIFKRTTAVLALPAVGKPCAAACINCGRCIEACPERLTPNFLARAAIKADFAACRALGAENCIGCGCCSYICPGRVPVAALIRTVQKEFEESPPK